MEVIFMYVFFTDGCKLVLKIISCPLLVDFRDELADRENLLGNGLACTTLSNG